MSEPLKPEEVVKFGDQLRKLFGWMKKFFKRNAAVITVCILPLTVYGCQFAVKLVRIVNSIPIPEPNPTAEPTSFPTPEVTATPTRTPNVVFTPTPTIAPTPTLAPEVKNYPIIGFQKIQGYNPKPDQPYNCHNPEDGPKFQEKNICLKDTTRYLCDPNNPGNCGPCDTDHMDNWNTFCLGQDYDPRKIRFTVKNGTAVPTDNPSQYEVHFTPGVAFTACASALPYGEDETTDGLKLQQKGNTETCVTEKYK